ncbi:MULTISPECIES: hypothetical protein [unclassified Spirosoma]|uniref:hypothetical protein n=1 Tax=unclassified Spirosoma TaxID=2621999 RepID=UPI000967B731|nr:MULTISPECIES: hypothetical protein [unclassified Spirosoma]MBN8823258.1 hypothetical protein [Spirosoma sp.]OJW72594.1 MAG: hypothetical protein BGO59_15870 [Spirosoma sp. 48-14]
MKRIAQVVLALLIGWILVDVYRPHKVDLRHFDPADVARLDTDMWRSYYKRKPLKLFWQSAELVRRQVDAPFWRSFVIAYHAAKAAFLFKDGKNRADYNRALPDLEAFYGAISAISKQPFNVNQAARHELEWWIIRREREQHPPVEWASLQAQTVANLYQIPVERCAEYGRLRTDAMLFRDQRGEAMTEADWQKIQKTLNQAWYSLAKAVSDN